MTMPLVSVLFPVYNGGKFLMESIDSILNQSFSNFEIIAINDGSTDNSAELLDAITDPRVRVFHQENIGLAATLNRGLSLARGSLIARQDQDDLSYPERLAKQVEYMQLNPDCVLLGTAAEIWVGGKRSDRNHDHPTDHSTLAFDLLFNNPFVHSSVMMRRDDVIRIGGYSTDPSRQPPEDYELWSRLARVGKVANLKERLLVYREVPMSMSRTGPNPFIDRLVTICSENLALANGQKTVDPVTTNVAALTHSAFHRLSKKFDVTAMCRAIENAAKVQSNNNPEIIARASERIRNLQYQAIIFKSNLKWLPRILRKYRNLLRQLG
ncbi:glycosyltransferase [Polynucleobacter paneuropaeus]|nr:glycosyltransferase [Polynucleobacter paneuropaeus]